MALIVIGATVIDTRQDTLSDGAGLIPAWNKPLYDQFIGKY